MRKIDIDVRSVRGQMELTRQEMATRLGVSISTVARWEDGNSRPSRLAVGRILELMEAGGISGDGDGGVEHA